MSGNLSSLATPLLNELPGGGLFFPQYQQQRISNTVNWVNGIIQGVNDQGFFTYTGNVFSNTGSALGEATQSWWNNLESSDPSTEGATQAGTTVTIIGLNNLEHP